MKPLLALRARGRGDVSRTHRVWSFDDGPDVPTPVTDGKYFYVVNDKGVARTAGHLWAIGTRVSR